MHSRAPSIAGGLLATFDAAAIDSLKILVPAAPGGGWDQTGRALQAALQSDNIVKKITVDNKGGAGGTIGLAQFVSSSKGDPNVADGRRHGHGRRDHHQQVAGQPVAGHADRPPHRRIRGRRGAGHVEDPVAEGPGGAVQGQSGQRGLGRRLRRRLGSHPGRHDRAGRRASSRPRSTTSRTRAAAKRRPRSWAGTSRRASAATANSPRRSSRASCARSPSPPTSAFPASTSRR